MRRHLVVHFQALVYCRILKDPFELVLCRPGVRRRTRRAALRTRARTDPAKAKSAAVVIAG